MSKMKRIIRNKKKKKFLRENPAWKEIMKTIIDKEVVKIIVNYNKGAMQFIGIKKQPIDLISIHFNETEKCRPDDNTKWLVVDSAKNVLQSILFIEAETEKMFFETHELHGIIYFLDIGYAQSIGISKEKINSWNRNLLDRAEGELFRDCVNL